MFSYTVFVEPPELPQEFANRIEQDPNRTHEVMTEWNATGVSDYLESFLFHVSLELKDLWEIDGLLVSWRYTNDYTAIQIDFGEEYKDLLKVQEVVMSLDPKETGITPMEQWAGNQLE